MKYHYEIQLNTLFNRDLLLTLKDKTHKNYIGNNISIIYIYKLVDFEINYPNKKGKVLYIGEACKKKDPTGLRFSQHIASKQYGGRGANINYTLHNYYWNGVKMSIDIYKTGNMTDKERKEIEQYLINSHIKIYGTLPIAQGTSGILVDNIDNIDEIEAQKFF
jgi:hypothetical protein